MRVAIVHDWLTGLRGGEKVLELLLEIFPEATIATLLRVPGSTSALIESRPIVTSFVQNLPHQRTVVHAEGEGGHAAVQLIGQQGMDALSRPLVQMIARRQQDGGHGAVETVEAQEQFQPRQAGLAQDAQRLGEGVKIQF